MDGQRRFGAVRLRGWYWHLPQPAINMEDFAVSFHPRHARYAVVCSGVLMLHLQLFPLSNETREEIHLRLHRDALPTTHVHNRIQSQTNDIELFYNFTR
jgi:hypothetical protein